MSTTAIARLQPFNDDQLTLIRQTVAKGTTPDQFKLFIEVCKHYGLNPFARQIYAVVRGNQMTIQTSIDGYRLLAERSGKYAGQIGPQWCGEDAVWVDVWLKKEPPAAARIGILRRDFDQPIWGIARYNSYVQSSSPLWTKMPDVLLAKCAESLGFRKAFPAEMAGIYTDEEMAQADHPLPATTVETIDAEILPIHQESQQSAPAHVQESQEPQVQAPPVKEIYELGLERGAWANSSEFRTIASIELSIVVNDKTRLTPVQRLTMLKVAQNEQQQKAS